MELLNQIPPENVLPLIVIGIMVIILVLRYYAVIESEEE